MTAERISNHPVLGASSDHPVVFTADGEEVQALKGDSVAGALWLADRAQLRTSPTGSPRGLYCGIGHCFECRVTVDGEHGVRSCLRTVRDGMRVETGTAGTSNKPSENADSHSPSFSQSSGASS